MVDCVLRYVPEKYKKNFYDNIEAFREAWEMENGIRSSIRRKEMDLVAPTIEKNEVNLDSYVRESILEIYRQLPARIQLSTKRNLKSHFLIARQF